MKHLKSYNESLFSVRKEGIIKLCKKYAISNYIINDDLSVDINGDVSLDNLDKIHNVDYIPLNFNHVSGNFDISYNSLASLKGCPKYVGGNFNCAYNDLTSLEFGPLYVGGDYSAVENHLVTLDYLPNSCTELFISNNFITNVSSQQISKIDIGYFDGIGYNPFDIFMDVIMKFLNIEINQKTYLEIVDKLEEFEVIKENTIIDMISLNSLFDYYNIPFTLTKVKLINAYNKRCGGANNPESFKLHYEIH